MSCVDAYAAVQPVSEPDRERELLRALRKALTVRDVLNNGAALEALNALAEHDHAAGRKP